MIRALTHGDRAAVAEVLRATNSFTAEELSIADELIESILERPDQKDYYGFVAQTCAGQPRTVTGLVIVGPVPATAGTWHMYWIAVEPSQQGTGVGQELAHWAENFVRDRRGYWLLAETSSQISYERTRAFYRKQGYAVLSGIADYYKPGDDLLIVGKRL